MSGSDDNYDALERVWCIELSITFVVHTKSESDSTRQALSLVNKYSTHIYFRLIKYETRDVISLLRMINLIFPINLVSVEEASGRF